MKKKEKQELHSLDPESLIKQVAETEKKLATAVRDRFTKPVKNVHETKVLRQRLAVLKTIVREKELSV